MKFTRWYLWLLVCISCGGPSKKQEPEGPKITNKNISKTALVVLGTVQDAGSPQIACVKDCCAKLFGNPSITRKITSLGLVDPDSKKTYLFEATPDITEQLKTLKNKVSFAAPEIPHGIFLTHAHIGHYAGLMYLGKEATNSRNAPVYTMPKMKGYLETNGPWSQLVTNANVDLIEIAAHSEIQLTPSLKVVPFKVPHRDEYSETVGFKIIGAHKKVLFIPDIDKWTKWETSIVDAVAQVDHAFLDATFYDANEINNRDISEIPHPFVIETMALFNDLPISEKRKIHFIHMNHTNPLLNPESPQSKTVTEQGFTIARMHDIIEL